MDDIVSYFKNELEEYRDLVMGSESLFSRIPRDNYGDPVINELAELLDQSGYTLYYPVKTKVDDLDHFIAILDHESHKKLEDDLILDVSITDKKEDKNGVLVEYISSEEVNLVYDQIEFEKDELGEEINKT